MKLNFYINSNISKMINNSLGLKIVKGNPKEITEMVDVLRNAAIEEYGKEYSGLIHNATKGSYIYHCKDYEELNEMVTETFSLPQANYQTDGLFIEKDSKKHIFITEKDAINILAHEMFGHAVSAHKKGYICYKGRPYERIGFQYRDIQTGEVKNKILNEGFTINIEDAIIGNIDKNLIRNHDVYKFGGKIAEYITNELGKEKILKAYALGIPIYDLFEEDAQEPLIKVSQDLDNEFNVYVNQKSMDQHTYYEKTKEAFKKLFEDEKNLSKCLRK